jgi:hypothetical protein
LLLLFSLQHEEKGNYNFLSSPLSLQHNQKRRCSIVFFVEIGKKKVTTKVVITFFTTRKPKEKGGKLPSSSRYGLLVLGPT